MTKGFRFAAVLGTATALLGGTAASAGAATLGPTSHSFGSQNVGVTSGAQAFTLTNGCAVTNPIGGGCLFPQFTAPGIGLTGDFAETNDCPLLLLTTNGQTCTINVTFTPTTTGERLGTLTTGGGVAALSGTGTTPAVVPPPVVPPPESPVAPTKKKCKKGFKKKKVKGKVKCVKKKKQQQQQQQFYDGRYGPLGRVSPQGRRGTLHVKPGAIFEGRKQALEAAGLSEQERQHALLTEVVLDH